MTIDDFDVNEISSNLAIREEDDNPFPLEAAHDDGHDDATTDVIHYDTESPASEIPDVPYYIHDDASGGPTHNDAHYDISG